MGLPRNIYQAIKRGTVGNAHKAIRASARGLRHVGGTVQGVYRFNRLKDAMTNFRTREMFDFQIESQEVKEIIRIKKHLKSYDERLYKNLMKIYNGSSEKFIEARDDILHTLTSDVQRFQEAMTIMLNAMSDSLKVVEELEITLLTDMDTMLLVAIGLAEKTDLVIPRSVTNTVKKEGNLAIREQLKDHRKFLNKGIKDVERRQNKWKFPKTVKTSMGVSWITFKVKRIVDSFTERGYKQLIDDKVELQNQINDARIKSDFFPRLLNYLRNIDKCRLIMDKVKKDNQIMFETLMQDFDDAILTITEFIAFFQKDDYMQEAKGQFAVLNHMKDKLQGELESEIIDTKEVISALEDFKKNFDNHLNAIAALSEQTLGKIRHNKEFAREQFNKNIYS